MTTDDANQPVVSVGDREATAVGNYFVANYPPFSFWQPEARPALVERLAGAPAPGTELGVYVHIPFCRKRCDFCYFKVYTDKDSASIRRYLEAVLAEFARYAEQPFLRGRRPTFVYFGGGTPSYLSVDQLRGLFDGLRRTMPFAEGAEVTFECEPGTLQDKKIAALKDLGVTRLSLGVENFDPEILALNNRAHRAKEIHRAYAAARAVGFDQINIDLIAGMVGETEANWRQCIDATRQLAPESVTIYQMEVPYNTTVYRRMQDGGEQVAPVADWATKRRWVGEAFDQLAEDGYHAGSAYTAVRGDGVSFRYRDGLWHGADMLGLGVASFSQLGGVHAQNEHSFEAYVEAVANDAVPVYRAYAMSDDERLVREFVLQLKLGRVPFAPFRRKFGVDPAQRFAQALAQHEHAGWLAVEDDGVTLSRAGLLRVDLLLPAFFRDEHRGARYA